MYEVIEHGLRREFRASPKVMDALPKLEEQVLEGRLSSFRAAERLLRIYRENKT
jgi:hypothetical protein